MAEGEGPSCPLCTERNSDRIPHGGMWKYLCATPGCSMLFIGGAEEYRLMGDRRADWLHDHRRPAEPPQLELVPDAPPDDQWDGRADLQ